MHLEMQPGVAARLFGDPILADQGITTRMLAVMPQPLAGTRFSRELKRDSVSDLSNFSAHVAELLSKDLPLVEGCKNQLKPRILEFCPDAKARWLTFGDEIEVQLGLGKALDVVRGVWRIKHRNMQRG